MQVQQSALRCASLSVVCLLLFGCLSVLPSHAGYEGLVLSGKNWEHRIGGLLQWDTVFSDKSLRSRTDEFLPTDDKLVRSDLRRTRLSFSGIPVPNWSYRLQWDFRNSAQDVGEAQTRIRDGWLRWGDADGPLFLQVGQQREPLSLELQTPSSHLVSVERSINDSLFYPRRSQGTSLGGYYNTKAITHINWRAGVFGNGDVARNDGGDNLAVSGRLALTWGLTRAGFRAQQVSDDVFHLGVFASYRDYDDSVPLGQVLTTNFQQNLQPEQVVLLTRSAEAPQYLIDYQEFVGLEAAVTYGAWYAQTEVLWLRHKAKSGQEFGDYRPNGAYAEAGWFITGEYRPFQTVGAFFDRIEPERPTGAWVLYFRWYDGALRDNSLGINTDVLQFGVNWHLNPQITFKLNYSEIRLGEALFISECNDATDADSCNFSRYANILTFRAQVDF